MSKHLILLAKALLLWYDCSATFSLYGDSYIMLTV